MSLDENFFLEENPPVSLIQLGRNALQEAHTEKNQNQNMSKSLHLYRQAESYFLSAIDNISDLGTKMSLKYLVEMARKNAESLEKISQTTPLETIPLLSPPLGESFYGRASFVGSRGKAVGVNEVPRLQPSNTEDEYSADLLQLESKLAHIGLMPSSVLLRPTKSAHPHNHFNFLTSNLEDSFLYLSLPPSSSSSSLYLATGRPKNGVRSPPPVLPSETESGPTVLPSTITNHAPLTEKFDRKIELNDKKSFSGPYGGKKKPQPEANYWGTAGGFLAWATTTTGMNQNQSTAQQKALTENRQQHVIDNKLQNNTLSINWNDKSVILNPEESLSSSTPTDSTAVLKLLETIARLNEENKRLEKMIETLQIEKHKYDRLKSEMEQFKREYQNKLSNIRQRIQAKSSSSDSKKTLSLTVNDSGTGSGCDLNHSDSGEVTISPEKVKDLERTVQALIHKLEQLKRDNKKKEETIQRFKNSTKSLQIPRHQQEDPPSVQTDSESSPLSPPRSPSSISVGSGPSHPNISAQHLTSLSQRRGASASPSTATLQTSLKSAGLPLPLPSSTHSSSSLTGTQYIRKPVAQSSQLK